MNDEVYLHIGVPKSGTTFIQEVLWTNLDRLRELGWSIAADSYVEHSRAAADVTDMRTGPRVSGAWDRQVERVLSTDGRVLMSQERLVRARADQVARVVRSLAPRPVTVVLTVRDLARQVASGWQQLVKHRYTGTLDELVTAVHEQSPVGASFWLLQDLLGAVDAWLAHVPARRLVVVTVPPRGSEPSLLWDRFAEACGFDPSGFDLDVATPNESLGSAQVEVLRRINGSLGERLELEDGYFSLVRRLVANDLLAGQLAHQRIHVDEATHRWATEQGQAWVDGLTARRIRVVGDLADLVPEPYESSAASDAAPATAPAGPRPVTDAEVVDAATELLADLLVQWQDRGRTMPRRNPALARDAGAKRRPLPSVEDDDLG